MGLLEGMIVLPIVCLFFVGVPVLCAVFVYRDAKKRGLNAGLWALLAFFTTIIGVVVYLLTRPGEAGTCGKCGAPVWNGFVVCPVCGERLGNRCVACGRALKSGWRLCPYCGHQVGEAKPPVPAPPPPPPRRISGLAVAALILTVVGPVQWLLLGIASLNRAHAASLWPILTLRYRATLPLPCLSMMTAAIAVGLAIAALVKIRSQPRELEGAWMAVLALILNGLFILIAFAAILTALAATAHIL